MAKFALIVGKILTFILGLFNRGSALPGNIALKIDADILSHFHFPEKCIVVTGTNGKTSTTRYLATIFEKAGYQVMSNFQGANLQQGIVTEAINHSNLKMDITADVAVLEIDEMTLVQLYDVLKPTEVVMTNLFPDQVDRFGSVEALAKKINQALDHETTLILNANDPSLVWIGDSHPTYDKVYYGLAEQAFDQPTHAAKCPRCGETLHYDFSFYEHIGYFHCENCDLHTPAIDILGQNVSLSDGQLIFNNEVINLPQANLYTVFNTLAALATAYHIGIPIEKIKQGLQAVEQIKGRGETLNFAGKAIYTNMAKNPAGMNQSITSVLAQVSGDYSLILAVNNHEADGVSTAWLNDCDFKRLDNGHLQQLYLTGMAKETLKTVLLAQDMPEEKIRILSPKAALTQLVADGDAEQYFILANYTALDDLYAEL